eukprot:scaffold1621_cov350-Prasinococcus_capsulatus_cf.AAC.29
MVRCKVCYITRDRGSPGGGERIHACRTGTGATSPATSAGNPGRRLGTVGNASAATGSGGAVGASSSAVLGAPPVFC